MPIKNYKHNCYNINIFKLSIVIFLNYIKLSLFKKSQNRSKTLFYRAEFNPEFFPLRLVFKPNLDFFFKVLNQVLPLNNKNNIRRIKINPLAYKRNDHKPVTCLDAFFKF